MPLLIADMPEIITPYIEANEPVQIASAPGVGKSETIDQMVAAYTEPDGFEWGLCKLFIAALSQVDMYGFLVPGETTWKDLDGRTHTSRISEFTTPPWMMSVRGRTMNSLKRGFVVLKEGERGAPVPKKGWPEPILN